MCRSSQAKSGGLGVTGEGTVWEKVLRQVGGILPCMRDRDKETWKRISRPQGDDEGGGVEGRPVGYDPLAPSSHAYFCAQT